MKCYEIILKMTVFEEKGIDQDRAQRDQKLHTETKINNIILIWMSFNLELKCIRRKVHLYYKNESFPYISCCMYKILSSCYVLVTKYFILFLSLLLFLYLYNVYVCEWICKQC